MDETEETPQQVPEAVVPETATDAPEETNGAIREEETQVVEKPSGDEVDDQEIKSSADVNRKAVTENLEEKEQHESDSAAADTSLTAEDEAHFQMLREAASSPPPAGTSAEAESDPAPQTSGSVLEQIAAIRAEGETTFTAAADFLQSIDLDAELGSPAKGAASADPDIENVVVDDAYIAALLRRAGATKVAASLEAGRISLADQDEDEDENASLISGSTKDASSKKASRPQSVSLPPLSNRRACPDKPFAVVFVLHLVLLFVLWYNIARHSPTDRCADKLPDQLGQSLTVKRLLDQHLSNEHSKGGGEHGKGRSLAHEHGKGGNEHGKGEHGKGNEHGKRGGEHGKGEHGKGEHGKGNEHGKGGKEHGKEMVQCKVEEPCGCFQQFAHTGHSIAHSQNAANFAECQALCVKEEQCQYFIYSGVPEAEAHPAEHCRLSAGPKKHVELSGCSSIDRACAHKNQMVFGHATCDLKPVPTCDALVQLKDAHCHGGAEALVDMCPRTCGVCAEVVSRSSVVSLWLALSTCSVLGFAMAYGFTGLYLNWKNVDRGRVLRVVQWLPGPLMIVTGLTVMAEDNGWLGVVSGLVFIAVGCVDVPLAFNRRAAAAARAGEMTEATLGFLGGMWVAVVASAGASLYFVLWSYFFAVVLQWENNTWTFVYLLYLLFNAYWVSNVARALVLLTLGGTVAVAITTAGAEEGRTHYSHQAKVLLLRGFFVRASTTMIGAACRWGLDAGWASGLWAIVVGMRAMSRCIGAGSSRFSRCINGFSRCAVPVIETSQRALLVDVILSGKSVGDAGRETWAMLCAGHENHNFPFPRQHDVEDPRKAGGKSANVVPSSPVTPGTHGVSWLSGPAGGRGVAHPAAWSLQQSPPSRDEAAAEAKRKGTAVPQVFDRLAVLDSGFSAYSPLLGPSVSGSFVAVLAASLTVLAGNDNSGVVWVCLAGFVITASVISISVSGVGAAIDAVQLCFIQEPETLARSYPVLFHRMTRLRSTEA